jgi:glycosyltransferase involved in cell wall biosynthesis
VPKKGLGHQLRIYSALRAAGVEFEARIAGGGPLRAELEREIAALDLGGCVQLCGPLAEKEIWALMAWADVLIHTGVIAPGGDRDGLPNVIPEAMAAGAIVVTSPAAATTEAIADGVTGLVAATEDPARWVAALQTLATDDALAESLRADARRWVEENFDAKKNTAALLELHREVNRRPAPP